jgi:hypothetical protein
VRYGDVHLGSPSRQTVACQFLWLDEIDQKRKDSQRKFFFEKKTKKLLAASRTGLSPWKPLIATRGGD